MKIILTIISVLVLILGLFNWKIRKKTTKKVLMLVGASVVIYVVSACIPEQNGGAKRIKHAEYIDSDMPLETLTDFSEERAFVQLTDYSEKDLKMAEDGIKAALTDDKDDAAKYAMKYIGYEPEGGNRAALIDTQGRIIWKSERTRSEQALVAVSEFRDGLAYFIFSGNNGESYNIIDLKGNVTYTKECSEDFMILSHGGGTFLIAEHIADFDRDEWEVGTIDKNGNVLAECQPYVISATPEEPLSVEKPIDPSSELQEIDDALNRLAEERQAWVEECWEYDGEMDEEYDQMISETEMDFQNRRNELTERKSQLLEQYNEQCEEYEDYLMEFENYDSVRQKTPETIGFDEYTAYDYQQRCEYLGENIYRVPLGNGYAVLNMDSKSVISVDIHSENTAHIEQFITGFENGSATVLYNEPVDSEAIEEEDTDIYWRMLPTNLYSLCHIETDGAITPMVSNSWTNYVLPNILNEENEFHDGLLFVPYRGEDETVYLDKEYYALTGDKEAAEEKGFVFHTGVYYNIDGEVSLELSEYNGNHIYFCDPFYNGHALVLIEGADQLTYFTVIDKSGKTLFEPKEGFDDVYMSRDGKYLTAVKWQNLTVFDIKGNTLVSVGDKQIDPGDGLHMRCQHLTLQDRYVVYDGVIRFRDFYVNVKEKKVIGASYDTDVEF